MYWKMLDFDVLRQQVPIMIYKRFELPAGKIKTFFIPTIDAGYSFLLRECSFRTSLITDIGAINSSSIEFIHTTRGRELQNIPTPLNLISTPGYQENEFRAAVAPVDDTAFNVSGNATPVVKNRLILNYLYQRNETIKIKLGNVLNTTATGHYLDLLAIGYYIPDTTLELWG